MGPWWGRWVGGMDTLWRKPKISQQMLGQKYSLTGLSTHTHTCSSSLLQGRGLAGNTPRIFSSGRYYDLDTCWWKQTWPLKLRNGIRDFYQPNGQKAPLIYRLFSFLRVIQYWILFSCHFPVPSFKTAYENLKHNERIRYISPIPGGFSFTLQNADDKQHPIRRSHLTIANKCPVSRV